MTQVSKFQLSEKIETQIRNIFAEIISLLSGKENVFVFLDDFLTQTEKIVLSKRIAIAFMLKKSYDYETIKNILKVSQSTVSAISLKLKYAGKGYHQVLDKILLQEKIKTSFDQIEKFILENLSRGKGKGTSFWKELKQKKQKENSSII